MHNANDYLDYQESPTPKDIAILFEGIHAGALKAKGLAPIQTFAIFLKNDNGNVLGGITGATLYGCLYVDMLWVSDELRHQGWGSTFMQEAEKIAKEKKCSFATVNTMDWEALPFYQKLGFAIEFVREGFEGDSRMYFLRKQL